MLVDAPNSGVQPVSPQVVTAPPPVKLTIRQTFQAALVVRLPSPARIKTLRLPAAVLTGACKPRWPRCGLSPRCASTTAWRQQL